MGGGRKHTIDAEKRAPFPLRQAMAQGAAGSAQATAAPGSDFCAMTHTVAFEGSVSSEIRIGLDVHLVRRQLPLVVVGERQIGLIPEPDATAMRTCLERGYRMIGRVEDFIPETGLGELSITGVEQES